MAENLPNLVKITVIQVQKTQSPIKDEPKQTHSETFYN